MAIAMISRRFPLSAYSSHLPARACSTGIPSPHVLRAPVHQDPLPTRLVLLPTSWSNGNKLYGLFDGNLPSGGGGGGFGSGGAGGNGGCRSGKPSSGDDYDGPGEGFRVLNCIVKLIRRLLQLGEPLLAGDLATILSSIDMVTEEMQCPSSSHSTDNHSDKRSRTTSKKNGSRTISKIKYSKRTSQQGARINNTQDHRVDMLNSDDETSSDKIEKMMKGRRSYVLNFAASSLAGALFLVPYWLFSCSDPTLSIPETWKDVLPIGHGFLIIIIVLLIAHSSQFKDGELPDNAGFKLLQVVQAVVFLFLLAGLFIPLHACRGMSNLVVWTSAAGALLMIVISWSIVFHHKTVIKCIKAPCQMVSKCTQVMHEKVQPWLPTVNLPECVKAKFKKMPEEKSYPGVPVELV